MNKLSRLIVLLVCAFFVLPFVTEASENPITVKLKTLGNKTELSVSVKGEYFLEGDEGFLVTEGFNYQVKLVNGQLVLYKNGSEQKKFSGSFTLQPKVYSTENYITVGTKKYLGTMKFEIEGSKYVRPVNTLPLEDYLKGVVPNEMPASWHKEALKAQAVAARTYALARIGKVIDDTVTYQSYGGYYWASSIYKNSNDAINETAGLVLRYGSNNGLIDAVFSSSNGGHTESNSNYWGTPQVPYLVDKPDSFDPESGWNFELEKTLINTSSLDLVNPSNWWSKVNESTNSPTAISNIRVHVKTKYHPTGEVKLAGISSISFSPDKTTGQKTKDGSLVVDYFVKNADGTFVRESGSTSEDYSLEHSGRTRYDTSIAIADYGWKDGAEAVVLGRGDIPVDALTGAVLAKKYNSPLLLTKSNELPSEVLAKIKDLNPTTKKVYLLGGKSAISEGVEASLRQNGYEPVRVFGNNRYQTSVMIANEISSATEAIITSGSNTSPDALSIASYAADNQIPILLSEAGKLSDDVINYLKSQGIKKAYVIGGKAAISEDVISKIRSLGIQDVERVSGVNRYATSVAIAERFSFDTSNVFIAQGETFIDALPGAVLASMKNAPVILTKPNEFSTESELWLQNLGTRPMIHYLGGVSAISQNARTDIKRVLVGEIKKHQATISGMGTLRSLIGGSVFKSYQIEGVKEENGNIVVSGKGFGHAVGMSQYGARNRAVANQSYQDILAFYYPGTKLSK